MKLNLLLPVKPCVVNQPFGGDAITYAQFGLKSHDGIDMRAYHGQPVYASHDGEAFYEVDQNQGHGVVVISKDTYDYEGKQCYAKTIYWHFCDPVKEPKFASPISVDGLSIDINLGNGQPVKAGDLIGYADSTGYSNGDHLHYGLKFGTFDSFGKWSNIEQNNGWKGATNPIPYLSTVYAADVNRLGLLKLLLSAYQQLQALLKLRS